MKTNETYSDPQLLTLLKQRNKAAWEWLYDRYSGPLFSLVVEILPDRKEAEWALEEAFLAIYRGLENHDPRNSRLFTWMLQLTRETALKKLRSTPIQAKKNAESTGNLMGHLEEEHKMIMQYLFFEGQSPEELAKRMNISNEALAQKIRLALLNLNNSY